MERVFEDYLGYVFKKHVEGFEIRTQDKSYFLVEWHKSSKKFRIIPDIVLNSNNSWKVIIDTKWKLINQHDERRNYNISQSDMYQLYAYGKKYELMDKTFSKPNLAIIYPKSEQFIVPLDDFIYEGDLKLNIIPFNLEMALDTEKEKEEVYRIMGNFEP